MEAKRISLESKIQGLSTDEGIITSIREKYHAVEVGESVAVIIDNDAVKSTRALTVNEKVMKLNWWQKILRAVGL